MKEIKTQQYTKLKNCDDNCSRCSVWNLVQRTIGTNRITDENRMLKIALYYQGAKCPEGRQMHTSLLYPANTNPYKNKKREDKLW